MLKDFNAAAHPAAQAILFSLKVFALVVLLAAIWEFGIEDGIFAQASIGADPTSFQQHLQYVATISSFAFIALIAPTYTLYRYIGRRDAAEQQARHLATHDPMTSLPNRNLLFDRLDQAIAQAHRHSGKLAVMFIDLNGFKAVNDLLGHNAGDFVLSTVATRLAHALRETDTVARFGGDEFVAIITEVNDTQQLEILTEKLKAEIATPAEFEGKSLSLGASIGWAVYPDHAASGEALINLADQAMYDDKENPNNTSPYTVQN